MHRHCGTNTMSTHDQNSTSHKQSNKRAQLDHLLLDADFFDKPKPRALIFKFGPIAQLYLIRLYAALSRATNAEISLDAALGVAWELRIEEQATAIINFCLEQEMLIKTQSGLLSSKRVADDQERLYQTREKWRGKQERIRGVSPETYQVTPRVTPRVTLPKSVNTDLLNTEDLNTEDLKENSQPPETEVLTLPNDLDTPKVRAALKLYCAKYLEKFKTPFDQILLDAALMNYNGPDELARDLAGSVGWKKIRDCSNYQNQNNGPPKKETNFDRNMKILQES